MIAHGCGTAECLRERLNNAGRGPLSLGSVLPSQAEYFPVV